MAIEVYSFTYRFSGRGTVAVALDYRDVIRILDRMTTDAERVSASFLPVDSDGGKLWCAYSLSCSNWASDAIRMPWGLTVCCADCKALYYRLSS